MIQPSGIVILNVVCGRAVGFPIICLGSTVYTPTALFLFGRGGLMDTRSPRNREVVGSIPGRRMPAMTM